MTQCAAKSKSTGERCRALAVKERNVCRIHGGKTPRGNTSARKHSIYEKFFTEEEKLTFEQCETGKLDDELLVARLQLSRALAAREKAKGELEVDTITMTKTGAGAQTIQQTKKKTDYDQIIDRAMGRIGKLEMQRAELTAKIPPTDNTPSAFEMEEYGDE